MVTLKMQSCTSPTLFYNDANQHVLKMETRFNTNPTMACRSKVGDIHAIPVSHGEGKFLSTAENSLQSRDNGQILPNMLTSKVKPSMDSKYNHDLSMRLKVSPARTGQIIGKMGHFRTFRRRTLPKIFQEIKFNISLHQQFNTLLENKRKHKNDIRANLLMKNVDFWDLGTPRNWTYFGLHSLQHRGHKGQGSFLNGCGSTKTVS